MKQFWGRWKEEMKQTDARCMKRSILEYHYQNLSSLAHFRHQPLLVQKNPFSSVLAVSSQVISTALTNLVMKRSTAAFDKIPYKGADKWFAATTSGSLI